MTTKTLEEIIANPITTTDALLTITMPKKKLPVGGHTFELKTEDDSGNVSQPAHVLVVVLDKEAPTAVLTVHTEDGQPAPNNSILFGKSFILSGKRSIDLGGGRIVKYEWRMID